MLPALLCLCLLVGMQSLGLHVHRHGHDGGPVHSHVVNAFDSDHEQAHVAGTVDEDDHHLLARANPQLPAVALLFVAQLLLPETPAEPALRPLPDALRNTGPPPHSRPQSHAPPYSSVIV
jgi:hypothetical protein